MNKNTNKNTKPKDRVARKARNPRITVCYTPEEYRHILEESGKAGLRKSQYVHAASLGHVLYQIMSDEQTRALLSLGDARSELVHIHNALSKKSQEELLTFFHDAEFMGGWIEATTYLIRRWGEIQRYFTKLQGYDS